MEFKAGDRVQTPEGPGKVTDIIPNVPFSVEVKYDNHPGRGLYRPSELKRL